MATSSSPSGETQRRRVVGCATFDPAGAGFGCRVQPSSGPGRGLGVSNSDADVYESVKDDLIRYATVLVGPDAAGDIVSTVVLRVLAKRSLTELREPRAYLFRAVLNEARSLGRRMARSMPAMAPVQIEDAPNLLPEVTGAVLSLPVRQRAATFLVYWAGCSTREAAELMGVGQGTVKRYLSLARDSLREVLHVDV
jgi:RNA polymerase sigma-70 factor (ECF subfamily)